MLERSIQYLKGVGPKKAENYEKLGIHTLEDLLTYFPRGYEDRTTIQSIEELQVGEMGNFLAMVASPVRTNRIPGGRVIGRVRLTDDTGSVDATFFNQPYLEKNLRMGDVCLFHGKVEGTLLRKKMTSPTYQKIQQEQADPQKLGTILPLYHRCQGISENDLRRHMAKALEACAGELEEYLPQELLERYELMDYPQAIRAIHQPRNFAQLDGAKKRLCFDELLILSLCMLGMKQRRQKVISHHRLGKVDLQPLYSQLPYALTGAQQRSIAEVLEDMKKETAMNRLVQGDVGSGKTMVAFAALLAAAQQGWQSALMAPTEILAKQHYQNLSRLAPGMGLRVALLTGSMTKKQKDNIKEQILQGEVDVVIGTHALIQKDVVFRDLSLVITDEQHRFGVEQRSELADKGGSPHILVMSATPIPRSLSFVIYGDLDLSVIDELPPGRQKVETHLMGQNKKEGLYGFILKEVKMGHQAYFICPLVEESEKIEVQSAVQLADQLQREVFPQLRVGCIHGKMKQNEKDAMMEQFAAGEMEILVSTTVIEVGIDVPTATVMVIEDADRFGLSQLHQLRGRVGRGSAKSYCFLVADDLGEVSRKRLKVLCSTNDGFEISRQDLLLRGPGDFFGSRQHGLPALKIADLFSDVATIERSRQCAEEILAADPGLKSPQNAKLKSTCRKFLLRARANSFN